MNKQDQALPCQPQQLLFYHYDELDAAGRQQVEQHLQRCSVCREELAELQVLLRSVSSAVPEPAPAELERFNARVMQRIQPRRRWFAQPALGWTLAGAAALLFTLNLQTSLPPSAPVPAEKSLIITAEQDVVFNLELLQTLELLEDFDLIQQLEQSG